MKGRIRKIIGMVIAISPIIALFTWLGIISLEARVLLIFFGGLGSLIGIILLGGRIFAGDRW